MAFADQSVAGAGALVQTVRSNCALIKPRLGDDGERQVRFWLSDGQPVKYVSSRAAIWLALLSINHNPGLVGMRERGAGFSLMELMVTVAIVAILVGLGVPGFMELVRNSRLSGYSNDFIAALNLARSEAVKRNGRVTMCKSSNGTACVGQWENGWIVFSDPAGVGVVDPGEEILLVNNGLAPVAYTIRGNNNVKNRVSFSSQGYSLGSNGQLAICYDEDRDGTGDFDDQNAWVVITSNNGRVRKRRPSSADVTLTKCDP